MMEYGGKDRGEEITAGRKELILVLDPHGEDFTTRALPSHAASPPCLHHPSFSLSEWHCHLAGGYHQHLNKLI